MKAHLTKLTRVGLLIMTALILACGEETIYDDRLAIRIEYLGPSVRVFQGHHIHLSVFLDSENDQPVEELNLALAYNLGQVTPLDVIPGEALDCWEEFAFEVDTLSSVEHDGLGRIKISAVRDLDAVAGHPSGCDAAGGDFRFNPAELCRLKLWISSDREYECTYAPIRFCWKDCDDNSLTVNDGRAIYLSSAVYDKTFEAWPPGWMELIPPDGTIDSADFIYGVRPECHFAKVTRGNLEFYGGGLEIACSEPWNCTLGDLDTDYPPNTMGDITLYKIYFLHGAQVFTLDSAQQVCASDVNHDGYQLTLADLVYMINLYNDVAIPSSHLQHDADTARFGLAGLIMTINATEKVGAVWLRFNIPVVPTLLAPNMQISYDYESDQTNVIIYSLNGSWIEPGRRELLRLSSAAALTGREAATIRGERMLVDPKFESIVE